MSFGIRNMIINSVKEKMSSLGAHDGMLNNTRTMLKEMVNNMQEKLKEIGSSENMMLMMNNRRAKMMKDGGGGYETMVRIKNLEESIKELIKTVERIGRSIASPPDMELRIQSTREMLQLNAPYFVLGLILVFFLWFCCRCCFSYCCRMKTVKMMKAPGRNFRMPRPNFEANPRSYFRNLHTSVKPKFG